jgi:hypothetical protein
MILIQKMGVLFPDAVGEGLVYPEVSSVVVKNNALHAKC